MYSLEITVTAMVRLNGAKNALPLSIFLMLKLWRGGLAAEK
jgi:hypothetical protein